MSTSDALTRLGRYQLAQVLGQGAMGMVYAATDPVLNRQVAIKTILRNQMLDPTVAADSSARFIREAQAVARLNHPHIVTVFDFGEEGEIAYIVMEFVRGRELKEHFDADEFFDLPQAIRVMTELLEALAYAHDQGVVHRDIKPANVMLDAAGRVKLTDFGVARLADSHLDRTLAGTMVGTPSYMSPEQIQGLPVGSRADLFAAGIILYQFLTRTKPFLGPGQWTILKQIVHDDPAPPSYKNSQITPAFDRIIERALAKDPAQRYASATAFAADLKRAAAGEPLASDDGVAEIAAPACTAPPTALRDASPPGGGDEITLLDKTVPLRADDETQQVAMEAEKSILVAQTPAAMPAVARSTRWLLGAGLVVAVSAGTYLAMFQRPAPQASVPPMSVVPSPAAASSQVFAPLPQAASVKPVVAEDATDISARHAAESGRASIGVTKLANTMPATKSVAAQKPPASPAKSAANPRCADFLQRFQLGETLSPEDLAIFQKECKQ